jgi:cell wall-associated NlpC family hydrolase
MWCDNIWVRKGLFRKTAEGQDRAAERKMSSLGPRPSTLENNLPAGTGVIPFGSLLPFFVNIRTGLASNAGLSLATTFRGPTLLRRVFITAAFLTSLVPASAVAQRAGASSTPRKKPFAALSASAQRLRDSVAARVGTSIKLPLLSVASVDLEQNLRDSIVAVARAQLGTRYKWGAESPTGGFDCSGLVRFVLGMFRLDMPRTADHQSKTGQAVPRNVAMLRPGDLLTFGRGKQVTHIGIYVGDGRLVHASTGKRQVVETTIGEATSWFHRHWLGARRLLAVVDTVSSGAQ